MAYTIEKSRDSNLENTPVPNLFITDFMPDAPDGDFVKVYIYAYMCCCQGEALTHTMLADRLCLDPLKVIAAWRYFAERRIVNLIPQKRGDESHFDVEFIDVKGLLYGGGERARGGGNSAHEAGRLGDPAIQALFQRIAVICGAPSIDGGDAQRILTWIEKYGAAPEVIEFAYLFSRDERGEKSVRYVEKIVKEWAEKDLKTVTEVREYRARVDARSAVHKKLMDALGLRYSVITAGEEKLFNLWLDDYGYSPQRLLELAEMTAGVGNKLQYLKGIIRKERAAEGKDDGPGAGTRAVRGGHKDRNEYYRRMNQKNEEAAAERQKEVYASVPAVKHVDDELSMLNIELIKTLTSGMKSKQSAVNRLNGEIKALAEQRRDLLVKAGFDPDYTDIRHDCPRCNDTGMLENGASCDCFTRKK